MTTFAVPFGNEGIEKVLCKTKSEKFLKKFCRLKKSDYLCNPERKQGVGISRKAGFFNANFERSLKRLEKVQASTKRTKNESVDSFMEGSGVRLREFVIYKEEFDPGSG